MTTNLPATIDDFENISHEALLAFAGQSKRQGPALPMLKINSMSEDDNGNPLPVGTYYVWHPEHGPVYSKNIRFRPFMNKYQYSVYDPQENKFTARTVFFDDFRDEAIDSAGTVKCGKVPNKDREFLSEADLEIQRKIKCQRWLFGYAKYTGVTATGDEVEIDDMPVIRRTGGSNFMPIGNVIQSLSNSNQLMWNFYFDLTTERQKNGGNVYYTVDITVDKGNPTKLERGDFEHLKTFANIVEQENDEVESLHMEARGDHIIEIDAAEVLEVVDPTLNDDIPL